jgi:hypothetical protein
MTLGELLTEPTKCPNCHEVLTTMDIRNQVDADTEEQAKLCVRCFESLKPHNAQLCTIPYCLIHSGLGGWGLYQQD